MFNKFLAAMFVSIFGMTMFECTSIAASAMVDNGLPEEFYEGTSSKASTANIEFRRNDGSAFLNELTYIPSMPKKAARDVSEGKIGYVDIENEEKESLSNEMKELVLASMDAFIGRQKGQASCIYLKLVSGLDSPKSPVNRKRIDSKDDMSAPNIFTMIIQLPVGLSNDGR